MFIKQRTRNRQLVPTTKILLQILYCSLMLTQLSLADCAPSQITINYECIDCNALFFGCTACSYRSDSIESIQCDTCDFNKYLLSINREPLSTDTVTYPQEGQVSICVDSCEDFAYNYVTNRDTGKCEYCGSTCTLCSPKYGCLADHSWAHGFKAVRGDVSYPEGEFPFSDEAPSTEFVTTTACADARCDQCDTYDAEYPSETAEFKQCDSCITYFNFYFDAKQEILECELCDLPEVENCSQCDSDYPDICLNCETDFFINKTSNECIACDEALTSAQGCKRCTEFTCLECLPGYYEVVDTDTGYVTCAACDLDSFNSAYILEPNRCSQCVGESAPTECLYCDIGFLESTSAPDSCELKCDDGQYPEVTYYTYEEKNNNENVIQSTECLSCDSSCQTCIGSSADQCTSCDFDTEYLAISSVLQQTGTCEARLSAASTPVFDIFVSNEELTDWEDLESSSIGLSYESPLYQIDDALERAKEVAGQYLAAVTVTVNIHLFRGAHYALETRGGTTLNYYERTQFNTGDNLNYELTIKPLECDMISASVYDSDHCFASSTSSASKVVQIYNKRREKLRFDVPVSLTLEGVVIDSLDSILHASTDESAIACLSETTQCCELTVAGVVQNIDSGDDFSCSDAFDTLFTTMETDCFANWPRSMFKMRLSETNGDIWAPNQLSLSSYSGIKNTFYAMNSLVSLTNVGGLVTMSSAQFDNMHTCGGIVKDSFEALGDPDLRGYVNEDYLTQDQLDMIETIFGYQTTYGGQTQDEYYMDTIDDTDLAESICADYDYCTQVLITSESRFQNVPFGQAVDDEAILVSNSNGLRNIGYIVTLEESDRPSSLEVFSSHFSSLFSPFDGCAPYDSLIADDETKVEVVGSLNNFRQLFNPASEFNLAQVTGPFILRDHRGPVVFKDNTFYHTISYLGTLSVEQHEGIFWAQSNIFNRNEALVGANSITLTLGGDYITDSTSLKQCGGIYIADNTFDLNIGCQDTTGAVLINCVADDSWEYNSIMDLFSYASETQMVIHEDISYEALSTTVNSATSQVQQELQANVVTVTENTVSQNFAGTGTSVVEINGFKSVTYTSNEHTDNENWITNSFRSKSWLFDQQSDTNDSPEIITDAIDIKTRARAIVLIRGVETLVATGCLYSQNSVVDIHSPFGAANTIQSNGILIEDLVGDLDLSDSSFTKNEGINGKNYRSSASGIQADIQGFASRLIAFHRVTITELAFDDVSFEGNIGSRQIDAPTEQQAQLFSFDQDLFLDPDYAVAISNLEISSNTFTDSESLVTFSLQDLYLDTPTITTNSGDRIILFEYLNDKAVFQVATPTVKLNTVFKGAILHLTEHENWQTIGQSVTAGSQGRGYYHFKTTGGTFQSNSVETDSVADRTENGPRTSCIEFSGQNQNWAYVYIGTSTTMINNQGTVTNDVYVDESVAKLEFYKVTWRGSTSQTSDTKFAQVIYKPWWSTWELYVKSCKFYCEDVDYDDEVIMENDVLSTQGRVSLFRLGEASLAEQMPLLQKEASERQVVPDGYLDETEFTMQFQQNTYTGCNQVDKGGIFFLEEGARLRDYRSDYDKSSAIRGGLAYVTGYGTYLHIESPSGSINNMKAYKGAVFYIENGATVRVNTAVSFRYNSAYEGTIAFAIDGARFIAEDNIQIYFNVVHRRGLFSITDGSQIILYDGQITDNTIGQDSAILHAENNRVDYHKIDGSVSVNVMENTIMRSWIDLVALSDNTVIEEGRVMTVIDSNITVSNTQFTFNEITTDNYGIFVSDSQMIIEYCTFIGPTFDYIHYQLDNPEYKDVNGAFLQVQENSLVWLHNSTFEGGRGIYGGCILMQGASRLLVEDSSFTKCTAQYGGAIYASAHLSLHIFRSTFQNNFAFIGYGQNIYSAHAAEQLKIEDSTLTSYHNSVYSSGYMILLGNVTMQGDGEEKSYSSALSYRADGGGVYIEQTAKVVIERGTVFRNLKGRNGGAIYLHQDRLTTTSLTKGFGYRTLRIFLFRNARFENCEAEFDGGAIYVVNPLKMTLQDISFLGNSARNEGGALQYICDPSPKERSIDSETPCQLVMEGSLQFNDNSARVGGAIRWNLMEMEIDGDPEFIQQEDGTITYGGLRFQNNKAELYGPEIAAVARELIKFSTVETYLNYYNGTAEEKQQLVPEVDRATFFNEYIYEGVQSGGDVPTLFLGLIDKYGQLVTINRGSHINFKLKIPEDEEVQFATEILGVTDFFSAYGTYNMSGMGLLTAPGNEIVVALTIDAVDWNIPSNADYLREQLGLADNSTNYALRMEMRVRDCILGEGLRESGACYECPAGTYLLQAPKEPQPCQPCDPDKTYCLGGKNVGPKPGYWRQSADSYKFWKCPREENCLGMDPLLPFDYPGNAVGLCDTENGMYGVMCTACLPDFKPDGANVCAPCQKTEIVRVILIMGGMTLALCFAVRGVIKGALKESSSSAFNKIMMNHLQMLIITSDFDMSWPDTVQDIFAVAGPINAVTEAIVNFDCFMDTRKLEDIDQYDFTLPQNEIRVYSQKVFIMAGLPIILGFIAYIIWWIICRIKREMNIMQTKFIATLVFLLFLIHPAMTKRMVDVFNCSDYDGVQRLNSDYQVRCFEDKQHIFVAYYVALPCLFIWGLGIPATVLTMMRKNKDKLTTSKVKQQFGFLYNGYKRHNYYWEIVIMYRKILCIFIAVFLRSQGVIVQALVLLIMLGIFLQANNTSRPFKQRQLNDIENMSVATQIITIYCGIFFISAKERDENFNANKDFELTESARILLVMVIAFCNTFFIILWLTKFLEISRDIIKNLSKGLYVYVFLCGRWDKLDKEAARRAGVIKREKIIANIEDTVLFLKKMKNIYVNNIFYEDHEKFLKLLYQIENESKILDLTEKRNNYYIQGPMARHRKFDRERMKELQNLHSLEIDESVVHIMEHQRTDGEKESRLRKTPFIQSMVKTRQSKTKSNDRAKNLRRMRSSFKSQQTFNMSPTVYDENSPIPKYLEGQQSGILQLNPTQLIQDSQSNFASTISPVKTDAESLAGQEIESPQDQPSPLMQQSISMVFVDENGQVIMDQDNDSDSDDSDLDINSDGKASGKSGGGKQVKKPKKKNDIYLDTVGVRSRNAQTNIIKKDKKNVTVGKLLNRDFLNAQVQNKGKLADALSKQGWVVKDKDKEVYLGEEIAEPSHFKDFASVETLDSQEQKLHIVRQLSDRREEAKPTAGTRPEKTKSQQDTASNADPGATGRGSIGSGPQGSVAQSPGRTDESARGGAGATDGAGADVASLAVSGTGQEVASEVSGSKKEADKKSDDTQQQDGELGPAAQLKLLEDQQPDDQEKRYEQLRPRTYPRRALHLFHVQDAYLDHSDSFIEKEESDDESVAPDKSVDASSVGDKSADKEAVQVTPRKERPTQKNPLEIVPSPESKFEIAMSPGKEEKPQVPERKRRVKKGQQQEKKTVVIDHGTIDVPMVEDLMAGKKLPKFKPLVSIMFADDQSSPTKSEAGEEELKVFDMSKSSVMSSSLHTDSSMRNYDVMLEPEELSFYLPPGGGREPKATEMVIGDGLNVMGQSSVFGGSPYDKDGLLEMSRDSLPSAGDKGVGSDGGMDISVEDITGAQDPKQVQEHMEGLRQLRNEAKQQKQKKKGRSFKLL